MISYDAWKDGYYDKIGLYEPEVTPEELAEYYEREVERNPIYLGENSYVPYFWEIRLGGGATDKGGGIFEIDVDAEDEEIFPVLSEVQVVRLHQDETGHVNEMHVGERI